MHVSLQLKNCKIKLERTFTILLQIDKPIPVRAYYPLQINRWNITKIRCFSNTITDFTLTKFINIPYL